MFFQGVNDAFSREMLRPVEGHVFQKVGQTVLVILFQNGPHILNNVKTGPFFGLLVLTEIIGKSVFQFPEKSCRPPTLRSTHLYGALQ